jgi:8-oxo-dGTP diphosphatase
MWADDRLWFPLMLAGQSFQGRFLFDGDTLLDHHVTIQP